MKQTSLDPVFMPVGAAGNARRIKARKAKTMMQLRHDVGEMTFNEAYDALRAMAVDRVERGETRAAIDTILDIDALIDRSTVEEDGHLLNIHAALLQILTALYIETDELDAAKATAAAALTLLAQEPKRKDEPFLTLLAALLYDIAWIHAGRDEYKQAEREIEKSLKLLERLARTNPERYGPAHIMALNASTQVYRNRVKQANLLAHYQAATSTYLQMVNSGIEDSLGQLIDSLHTEGVTLARMGRHREAVGYFTRALKYLTKVSPDLDVRQLEMSIDLGESLLNVKASRDKGVHLLNTLLHKATKLKAEPQHRRIVEILANTKSRNLDILDIWHKMFPR